MDLSSYTPPSFGCPCSLVLICCTESYFLSLFPHFLSPYFLFSCPFSPCHPLTSDHRFGDENRKKAVTVAAPFADGSTWSGQDNGPVLVQPRARARGDGVQCDWLLVLQTVHYLSTSSMLRESPLLHLPLFCPTEQRAGRGRGFCVQLGGAGQHFPCHTVWLADRGPL